VVGQPQPPVDASGADTISGNAGRDEILGGGANDTIHGNDGDDHAEGGAGNDAVTGDAGDDDLVGGGSSLANGVIRHTAPAVTAAATVTNLADGNDTIDGGTGEDAVLGDNGVVSRVVTASGAWTYQPAPFTEVVKRVLQAPVSREAGGAFGNDTIVGGDGHDELYGELGDDTVSGNAGDDTLLGDLGKAVLSVNGKAAGQNGNAAKVLKDSASFLNETVYVAGTLQRDATLYDIAYGGRDVLDGGTGNDALHSGAGNDTLSGNAGATNADPGLNTVCVTTVTLACDRDVLFGGDGDDTMWGGTDKDHMYGGYGTDHIDVVRPGTVDALAKFKGPDVMYGGWQQDAMQADVSSPSPNGDDKLIDSTGVYNIYYVCEGAYGGNSVVRSPSPSMQSTLQSLAAADGATTVATAGSSGFDELSMVFTNEFSQNSSPAFVDSPGSFTCA
jgi:Ca2+-binding RTX toxin-like protein